jgi:membrane-associated phospholipid phosphatase
VTVGDEPAAAGSWSWDLVLGDLAAIDDAVYRAVAATPSPTIDRGLARLSRVADRSLLWIAIAGGLALFGGTSGRRAARAGLASIAAASGLVNIGLKPLHGRTRPDAEALQSAPGRAVAMPRSASFPSGHSASAFAFATAAGGEMPWLAFPLRSLAAAVAYSRVHGGAHYPADVVAGSLIGGATASATVRALQRL